VFLPCQGKRSGRARRSSGPFLFLAGTIRRTSLRGSPFLGCFGVRMEERVPLCRVGLNEITREARSDPGLLWFWGHFCLLCWGYCWGCTPCILIEPSCKRLYSGSPNGVRTRVFGVRGRYPRPLDDGTHLGGWGTRIRTWIGRSRVCSPTVERFPSDVGNLIKFLRQVKSKALPSGAFKSSRDSA
jgi:hypothetical protein